MKRSVHVVLVGLERGEHDLRQVTLIDFFVAVVVVELHDDGRHHRVPAVPVVLHLGVEARVGHDFALGQTIDVVDFRHHAWGTLGW